MVGFFSLCLCRKKVVQSSNKHDHDENTKKSRDRFARETEESINDNDEEEKEKEEETQKTIPLPPGMTNKKTSAEADSVPPTNYRKTRTKSMAAMPSSSSSSSSKSSKKLLVSLSMKVRPGGKKGKVLKHEDSIWKKTIILGERCRVPDQEDDAVCYDENGNKISTYHPRLSNSVPVSRQNSFIDDDAIPKHHRHRHRRQGNGSSSSSSSATGHN